MYSFIFFPYKPKQLNGRFHHFFSEVVRSSRTNNSEQTASSGFYLLLALPQWIIVTTYWLDRDYVVDALSDTTLPIYQGLRLAL